MDERALRLALLSREMNSGRMTVEEGLKQSKKLDETVSLATRMERLARRRERDRARRAAKKAAVKKKIK